MTNRGSDGRELKNGAPEDPASQTAHSGGLESTPPDLYTLGLVSEQIAAELRECDSEIKAAILVGDRKGLKEQQQRRAMLWDDEEVVWEAVCEREAWERWRV